MAGFFWFVGLAVVCHAIGRVPVRVKPVAYRYDEKDKRIVRLHGQYMPFPNCRRRVSENGA